MAYALTNGRKAYVQMDIELAFRELDTSLTAGANLDAKSGIYKLGSAFGKGKWGMQPTPHASIHGADELHNNPLFARARITTGGATTHSTMDQTVMVTALVVAFNDPNMQPFLAQLDAGTEAVNVNVNYNVSPGTCNVFSGPAAAPVSNLNQAVIALVLKIRRNPSNATIPIIQTSIPYAVPQPVKTKKGKVVGFTV